MRINNREKNITCFINILKMYGYLALNKQRLLRKCVNITIKKSQIL